MANPIAVKGIRRIIDKLGDEVLEAAKKAQKLGDGANFRSAGKMELDGEYGFDKNGDLGFVGKVVANIEPGVPIAGADGEIDTVVDSDWSSIGEGHMKATFEVEVTLE